MGEGNVLLALSLSRWKSDARLEGELPLWKRKSGGWKASAFCLNRSRPASRVASPSGEASLPEAACKVGCVLHLGNLQRAIAGRLNFKGRGLGVRGRCGPVVGGGDQLGAGLLISASPSCPGLRNHYFPSIERHLEPFDPR